MFLPLSKDRPLLDHLVDDDDYWTYYRMAAAEYRSFRDVMLEEEKAYFYPSIVQS